MTAVRLSRFIIICLTVGCMPDFGYAQIRKRPDSQWGVSALTLGKAAATPPTVNTPLQQWTTSPVLNQFYKAGGETGRVNPTQARIAWDAEALYVGFLCGEPHLAYPAHHRSLKLADWIENAYLIDTYFPDRVDVFFRPNWKDNGYYQFSATLSGDYAGIARGDLTKVANLEAGGVVEKDKTSRLIAGGFEAAVRKEGQAWRAFFRIPWGLLGGRPAQPFGLLLNRTRWRDSERLSPVALDFDDKPTLDLFMETTFGKGAKTVISDEMLTRLPSGVLRWQRPATLVYPSVAEKGKIWTLQGQLTGPTTPTNLGQRIWLTQRWMDLLILEGFNFRKQAGGPIAQSLQPHQIRRTVNAALRAGRVAAAADSLDAYLRKLDAASRNWYADESPGNIRPEEWVPFTLTGIVPTAQEVVLTGKLNDKPYRLFLSCPQEGGIRLRGEHSGFFNATDPDTLVAEPRTDRFLARSKRYSFQLEEKSGRITIRKGTRTVLVIDGKDIRFRLSPDGQVVASDFIRAASPGEVLYGLGERYDAADLKGKTVTLWGMDDYLGLITGLRNQTYKPVPLLHSTAGYSLFFNTSYRLRADLGQTQEDQLRITAHGPVFDLYVYPERPDSALVHYTNLTGKPVLPPRWAFKPWMGGTGIRWKAKGNPGEAVIRVARQFAELDIPHSATYAEGAAADDPKVHAALAPMGIRVFSWMNSSIAVGQQQKLLVNATAGEVPALRYGDGQLFLSKHKEYLDFTHPKAARVVAAFWKRRLDLGVAGSMVDFGDEVPEAARFYDGRSGAEMHNFYAYDYHRAFAQAFRERRGDDFILFGRAGSAGSQRWMAQFAGDHRANFTGLRAALYGALHLGACGFSIWGSDTGGFFGLPDPLVYNRWVQFSCFSPLMRFHGTEPREPWEYGGEAVRNYKHYAWVRESLVDYLYGSAAASHLTGLPMMRNLAIAFPDEPDLAAYADEYMLGSDLLVAPGHTESPNRPVAFPEGKWVNLWTNQAITGPARQTVVADSIPVYLKAGAVLPVQLAPSLAWGESMQAGRVPAVIVTPPDQPCRWKQEQPDGKPVLLTNEPAKNGFVLTMEGRPSRYLIVYGAAKITRVTAGGTELAELSGPERDAAPPGWYRDAGQRLIVRLPHGVKQEIEIEW